MTSKKDDAPVKLTRAERRHGRPAPPPPVVTIPKPAFYVAAAVLLLAVFLGVRTSLKASSHSAPFSMEDISKKSSGGAERKTFEENPRDRSVEDYPNGDWLEDIIALKEFGLSRCDFDRVHHSNMTTKKFSREYEGIKPVVIEGLINERWPAKVSGRWSRPSLIDHFADATLKVSTGAGIVHSGGQSTRSTTLGQHLEDLREPPEDGWGASATDFTFDLEFFEDYPELRKDFKIPTAFRAFNSYDSMRRGLSWNMLSLGSTLGGLPFHTHGETWLGLVYGAKRWSVYSPQSPRPHKAEEMSGFRDLDGSQEWLKNVLPLIKKTKEEFPLECMQNAGDLVYLPTNWKHQTLNIGEAIGVGGQAVYLAEVRLQDGIELLKATPGDPDILHSIGLGLAHRGVEMLRAGVGVYDEDDESGATEEEETLLSTVLVNVEAGRLVSPNKALRGAAECFRQVTVARPTSPEPWILRAECLQHAKLSSKAESVMQTTWEIFSREALPDSVADSTIAAVRLNIARFYLQENDGKVAEKYLLEGPLALYPKHPEALSDLAVALTMQGRNEEAVSAIKMAGETGARGKGYDQRREYVMDEMMRKVQQEMDGGGGLFDGEVQEENGEDAASEADTPEVTSVEEEGE